MDKITRQKQEVTRARLKRKQKHNQHFLLNIMLIVVSFCIIVLLVNQLLR